MITPEFSRPIALDRVGLKERSYEIEADQAECAALAKRLGVPAVNKFAATIRLRLTGGGKIVRMGGEIRAELTQICVVTLEPMRSSIQEDFSRLYSVEAEDDRAEVVIEIDEDLPDPIEDGHIDMGEAAAEHLALAMDPFPRSQGAAFTPPPEEPLVAEVRPSPFAALASVGKKE